MNTSKPNHKTYDCIRRWGYHMGSEPYYINDVIERARAMDAPSTAIYYHINECRWVKAEEIVSDTLRREILGLNVKCPGCGNPPYVGCSCVSNKQAIGRGERAKGEREEG